MSKSLRPTQTNSTQSRWVRPRNEIATQMTIAYKKKVKAILELLRKQIKKKICSWSLNKCRKVAFLCQKTRFKWPNNYSRKVTKYSKQSNNWIQQWSSKCFSISSIMCCSGSAYKNSLYSASSSYSFWELQAKCGSFFSTYCISHAASLAYKYRNMCQSRTSLYNWWSQERMKNHNFKCHLYNMRLECKQL